MPDERDTPPRTTPPETPPPIVSMRPTREGRQWAMLLIYLLIALVVAASVVFGGRWLYNTIRDEPAQETTTTTDRSAEPPTAPAPSQPGTAPQAPPPQPTPTPQPTPAPTLSTQGAQIANTGPGETIAIFVGASALAGGIHYLITQRKRSAISKP